MRAELALADAPRQSVPVPSAQLLIEHLMAEVLKGNQVIRASLVRTEGRLLSVTLGRAAKPLRSNFPSFPQQAEVTQRGKVTSAEVLDSLMLTVWTGAAEVYKHMLSVLRAGREIGSAKSYIEARDITHGSPRARWYLGLQTACFGICRTEARPIKRANASAVLVLAAGCDHNAGRAVAAQEVHRAELALPNRLGACGVLLARSSPPLAADALAALSGPCRMAYRCRSPQLPFHFPWKPG